MCLVRIVYISIVKKNWFYVTEELDLENIPEEQLWSYEKPKIYPLLLWGNWRMKINYNMSEVFVSIANALNCRVDSLLKIHFNIPVSV